MSQLNHPLSILPEAFYRLTLYLNAIKQILLMVDRNVFLRTWFVVRLIREVTRSQNCLRKYLKFSDLQCYNCYFEKQKVEHSNRGNECKNDLYTTLKTNHQQWSTLFYKYIGSLHY